MSSTTLQITLLASEWNSSKGGLSTMNRELAIELAKHPNVSVTFFVPKCTEDDKKQASSHNITIVEARERPGFDPIDWLSFPPRDLVIDIIIGHGVKLGKQAQVIMEYHHCKWMQVVHTVPEELAMFKTYSSAISKGDEKQWTEVKLCKIADLVVAVGSKLCEVYSRYLSSSGKTVFNLTPSIFTELSNLKPSIEGSKKFWVLVFGRGDSEDFELKGFDIAAKAVAELNDRSYHIIFVGAPSGNETQVAEKLLEQGLSRSQLTVKGYLENREDLATLLSTANLAIIPSRTEGFGLTALEALSAGLPFLVSQNSGFGEALHEIPYGSSWIVDSEDPEPWAEAIKAVREKGRETALKECQELRTHYAEKYSWKEQCNALVEKMLTLVRDKRQMQQPDNATKPDGKRVESKSGQPTTLRSPLQKDQSSVTEQRTADRSPLQKDQSVTKPRTADSLFSPFNSADQRTKNSSVSNISTARANTAPFNSKQGARPKEVPPSSTGTQLKGIAVKEGTLDDDDLEELSKSISTSWMNLGRRLKITQAKLDEIDARWPGLAEKAYRMLLYWKQENGSTANYQVLSDVLCHKFVNRKDLAEDICFH